MRVLTRSAWSILLGLGMGCAGPVPENAAEWRACVECIETHSDRDDEYSVRAARTEVCKSLCEGLRGSAGQLPGEGKLDTLQSNE